MGTEVRGLWWERISNREGAVPRERPSPALLRVTRSRGWGRGGGLHPTGGAPADLHQDLQA